MPATKGIRIFPINPDWQPRNTDILWSDVCACNHRVCFGYNIVVADHNAFGSRGGAGGVLQERQIIRGDGLECQRLIVGLIVGHANVRTSVRSRSVVSAAALVSINAGWASEITENSRVM